jgi:hypothetical protein
MHFFKIHNLEIRSSFIKMFLKSKMCMISGDVEDVSNTKIFCAFLSNNKQITVYSNQIKTIDKPSPSAMILPVPNKVSKVIDMTKYPNFFEKLNKACTPVTKGRGGNFSFNNSAPLPVQRCGSYRYTIVPNIEQFKNVQNNVFDVDLSCLDYMKKYYSKKFEFIVCILDKDAEYSPFAYVHDVDQKRLFVPTRHYHTHPGGTNFGFDNKGGIDWDHSIYTIDNSDIVEKWNDGGKNTFDRNIKTRNSQKIPDIPNFYTYLNWRNLKKRVVNDQNYSNGDILILSA